jgi:hypothetical protein
MNMVKTSEMAKPLLDKIIFCKPIKNENKYKIKVFVNSEDKINKLCVLTPLLELNVNWNNLKFQSIKFPLEPMIGPILDFYNLISDIEYKAYEQLKKIFGDIIQFKSSISELIYNDDEFLDSEQHSIFNFTGKLLKGIILFNENGEKIKQSDIQSTLINYKLLIELTDIWFDLDTNLGGCNFNIVQIKKYPHYYENDLILNENVYTSHKSTLIPRSSSPSIISPKKTLSLNTNEVSIVNDTQPIAPRLLISNDLLSGALKGLKKVI